MQVFGDMWLKAEPTVEIKSALPMAEFLRRLNASIDLPMSWFGNRPVMGDVTGSRIWLQKRINYRNSFQVYLIGTVTEHSGQTRVTCSFSMHIFVKLFFTVWFGLLGCFTLIGFAALFGFGDKTSASLLGPMMMLLGFGYCLIQFGLYAKAAERQFLIKFLTEL